jgi:4-diphosphocytidyl-2-C-methyl-D-erythritol kinase
MENTIFPAYAKLNLSLNLLPVRGPGNYFTVRFINVQLDLHDSITLDIGGAWEGVAVEETSVPIPEKDNLALRAAEILAERFALTMGIRVSIDKRIPVRAGLGGGSSDAAAVINGMTELLSLPLSEEEKNGVARELGMDVCYCVRGGLCEVGGIGDVVNPLFMEAPRLELLLALPAETKPSTAWAYSVVDERAIGGGLAKLDGLVAGLRAKDPAAVAAHLHNDFAGFIERAYPVTRRMRETMVSFGAAGALLAGSGLTVFGIFTERAARSAAARALESEGVRCIETSTLQAP